jgi:hypothetical protein
VGAAGVRPLALLRVHPPGGRSGTPRAGSPPSAPSRRWTSTSCPPAPPAPTARRSPAPGPTATPSRPAGSRWPARRWGSSPRSTTCPWRTSSRPTTCAGSCGRPRAPATPTRSPRRWRSPSQTSARGRGRWS